MTQQISCPHCRNQILCTPEMAGQAATCPHCDGQIQMPPLSVPTAAPARPAARPAPQRPAARPAPRPPATPAYQATAPVAATGGITTPASTSAPTDLRQIRSRVQGPAIAMMVCAALGALGGLLILGISIRYFTRPASWREYFHGENGDIYFALRAIGGAVAMLCMSLVFYGATQMMALKNYSSAKTAATLTAIPIFTCFLLGIPTAIWAFTVLNDPEVRRAFRGGRGRRRR